MSDELAEEATVPARKRSVLVTSEPELERWLEESGAVSQNTSIVRQGLVGRLFEASYELLTSLLHSAKKQHSIAAGDMRQCQNELERLFLWGDGFGASDGSLDDILHKSTELKINVLSLLSEIAKIVSQNIFNAIKPSEPTVLGEFADLQILLETTEAVLQEGHTRRNSIAFSDSEASECDFTEAIDDIAVYTNCLMDLAPALEHPAVDAEIKEEVSIVETFQVSSIVAANYCRKIRDRFPDLNIRIVEKLGEANQKRSRRLQEAFIAAEAVSVKQTQDPDDGDETLFSRSGGKHTDTTKSTYVSDSVFSTDQDFGISKEEYDDVLSQTTFDTFSTAFSTVRQGMPRVPSLPKSARSGARFKCVACGKVLRNIRNRRIWKKHIFNDLQPYVCLADDSCLETFSSRSAWIKHETGHLVSSTQNLKCSFCPPTKSARPSDNYFKHVGRHMREVALAVLPQSHDFDSDSEAGSVSSEQALSDISSLGGSEAGSRSVASVKSEDSINNIAVAQAPDTKATEVPEENAKAKEIPVTITENTDSTIESENKPIQKVEYGEASMDSKPTTLASCRYKTGKTLDVNSSSVIKECIHIDTGRYYAAKVINKRLLVGREHIIRNEIAVLKKVSMGHKNIVTLVDYFETMNNVYLVMDLYLGGELFDRICRKGSYYESDAAQIVESTCSAVAYLHDEGIVHRDLKPENLVFRTPDDNADLLVANFDLSRIIDKEDVLRDTVGTPGYMAPEIFKKTGHGKPADMWAIGVITYFLLCGYTPFDRDSNLEEMQAILVADYSFTPIEYWRGVSASAREFIKRCLMVDPQQRITAHEALSHPFVLQRFPAVSWVPVKRRNFNARRTWYVGVAVVMAVNKLRKGQ
ncbi:hypothetical protein BP6252_13725 [Coleophoma cylindrospora]|uniref:Protein kinase domain-containing protein n=1 Tax=Coleophoma cylindrospora TaxID=1849047 RepID=A0A3D8Q748_9HELO|nr:hypothetical protein BP6252_13725 [Coleophoma cylindrospora]